MPHVAVKLREGYSRVQKARLADALAATIVTSLDCPNFDVSVAIEDVSAAEWAERVYEPDIASKSSTIYKHPGYAKDNHV
jgi:phenylpyruvate tautomerase PptA (4-oxalocrotonate tautomerase family)